MRTIQMLHSKENTVPELNPTFLKEISSALNSTRFSSDDFDLNEEEYGKLLRIQFKHDERFSLTLKEDEVSESITTGSTFGLNSQSFSKEITKLFCIESPGKYKTEDEVQVSGFSDVPKRILSWCQNIHRELKHDNDSLSDIEKEKEIFKESISIEVNDPNAKFSKEEVDSLSSKLDDLFDKFNELSEKYNISESELDKLREDIESLKDNAQTYKQGIWAKITENKLAQFVFDFLKTKEGIGLLIDSIKKIGN